MEEVLWNAIEANDVGTILRLRHVRLNSQPPFRTWVAQSETCWLGQCEVPTRLKVVEMALEARDYGTLRAALAITSTPLFNPYVLRLALGRGDTEAVRLSLAANTPYYALATILTSRFPEECDEVLIQSATLATAKELPVIGSVITMCPISVSEDGVRLLSKVPKLLANKQSHEFWRGLGTVHPSALQRIEATLRGAEPDEWEQLLVGAIKSSRPCEQLDYLLPLLSDATVLTNVRVLEQAALYSDLADYAPLFDRGFAISAEAIQRAAATNEHLFFQLAMRAPAEQLQTAALWLSEHGRPEMLEGPALFLRSLDVF